MNLTCPICSTKLELKAVSRDDQRWWKCNNPKCEICTKNLMISFNFVGEDGDEVEGVDGISNA